MASGRRREGRISTFCLSCKYDQPTRHCPADSRLLRRSSLQKLRKRPPPARQTSLPPAPPAKAAKQSLQQFTEETLLQQPGLLPAQVGICLFDPATSRYLYNLQGDKYFIPASNTKLFSLYAGLKHLGDSLVGIRYRVTDTAVFIQPTGDPTLLHPDFPDQPVIRWLQKRPSQRLSHRRQLAGPPLWPRLGLG